MPGRSCNSVTSVALGFSGLTMLSSTSKASSVLSSRLPRTALSWRRALAGLLLAVAVLFGGVLEASACASEPITVAAAEAVTVDDGGAPLQDDSGPAAEHKACAHGHCHHGQFATPERHAASVLRVADQRTFLPVEIRRPGAEPARLKRPPRI